MVSSGLFEVVLQQYDELSYLFPELCLLGLIKVAVVREVLVEGGQDIEDLPEGVSGDVEFAGEDESGSCTEACSGNEGEDEFNQGITTFSVML